MRRSVGKQQARLTRQLVQRLSQTPQDRARASSDPSTHFSAGTVDAGTGAFHPSGMLDLTELESGPFYLV